jgi:hypothetical protein
MLRITAICLVLSATAMLLAGCGSSSHTSASSAAFIAGPPISGAQALAYAHAINLRAGDVPGTTSKRTAESVETVKGRRKPSAFLRCAGLPTPRMVLMIHSATFGAPYWWLRSTVEVMPSNAFATAYAALLGSSRGRRCLFAGFPRPKGGYPTVSSLPVAPPIVGIRVDNNFGAGQSHRDLFAFASGRAIVTLLTEGEYTPPLTTEQRLASLLYARAEAHKL